MHADCIEILNGHLFDRLSSRSILLHSFLCKICVPRHIKTLFYYVFVMDKVHTVANRRQNGFGNVSFVVIKKTHFPNFFFQIAPHTKTLYLQTFRMRDFGRMKLEPEQEDRFLFNAFYKNSDYCVLVMLVTLSAESVLKYQCFQGSYISFSSHVTILLWLV